MRTKADEIKDAPELYRTTIKRAMQGKGPRARDNAIKAFCLQCTGYVRKDITTCSAPACALYEFRPYQIGDEEAEVDTPACQ